MFFTFFLQVFLYDEEGPISPFHDVPLVAQEHPKTFHVVIEVTRKASSLKGPCTFLLLLSRVAESDPHGSALFLAAGSGYSSALVWKAESGSGTTLK